MADEAYFQVGGSLGPGAPSYVDRAADDALLQALERGAFCHVLNARQMGKSSLLIRATRRLMAANSRCRCVIIDLSLLSSASVSEEQWYRGIATELWLALELGLLPPCVFFLTKKKVVWVRIGIEPRVVACVAARF